VYLRIVTAATEETRDAVIQAAQTLDQIPMVHRADDTTVLAVSAMTGEEAGTILQHLRKNPQRTAMPRQLQ
jgi:hypothetical protein